MGAKKQSPADALKTVVETLTPLEPNERQWVLQSAGNLWSVSVSTAFGGSGHNPAPAPGTSGQQHAGNPQQEPKSFMKAKNPQSETQRVACLAYFLTNSRSTPAFKTTDITALNTEARGPTFNVARAVGNAANAKHKYLSSIGKGQKQITSHGEEIVDALPDLEKVKEIEARKPSKRGRPKKKKKSKGA